MNGNQAQRNERREGWRSNLAIWTSCYLVFETITGLSIWLLPFSVLNQIFVIAHTALGVLILPVAIWYSVKHWLYYRKNLLTHLKLFGYIGGIVGLLCVVSGIVLTVQALLGTRISYAWDLVHIATTVAILAFLFPHLILVAVRDWKTALGVNGVKDAVSYHGWASLLASVALILVAGLAAYAYQPIQLDRPFPDDYSYKYGVDRPFAPSQAVTETGIALDSRALSGSHSCGTAGCHPEIVHEWEGSAHRYSAMDIAFQKIQLTMADQNGPESTRYCGGCHDPISLFSGTKNIFTDTDQLTSLVGYQEGVSCLACHGIHQTDLKGNAHYVISAPRRYMFEIEYAESQSETQRLVRDFLIRSYPKQHVDSLSKRMFKTPEYCAACHKQFIDEEINNVGWVQLQNQYDNWRKSHWNHPDNPTKTIECRECHMPLVDSKDPAAGDDLDYNRNADDGKHRSHRFIAANQLMPALLKLPGWEEQTRLTEQWLKGEFEIPEIADKWASGPAVTIQLTGPESVRPGEQITLSTAITSNKVGHDFPTGPLDIIQAWVELVVVDDQGREVYATGRVDEGGFIEPGSFIFKAEPVDQYGNLIDRHNLWEMVGVRHRRALFPGFGDTTDFSFACPDLHALAGGQGAQFEPKKEYPVATPDQLVKGLRAKATLKYRKIDQYLLKFVFGDEVDLTAAVTDMASHEIFIPVKGNDL